MPDNYPQIDSLSNSFVYGINWDGTVLLQGQLTARMAWQMMLTAKRIKKNKAVAESYKQRAIDAFQLLEAYEDDPSLSHITSEAEKLIFEDKILKSWIGVATASSEFKRVKSSSFREGVHFIVIFHKDKEGKTVVNTYIVSNHEFINGQKLKLCAAAYFHQLAMQDPTLVPPSFLEQNPYYIR